jgi:hypothetical protein
VPTSHLRSRIWRRTSAWPPWHTAETDQLLSQRLLLRTHLIGVLPTTEPLPTGTGCLCKNAHTPQYSYGARGTSPQRSRRADTLDIQRSADRVPASPVQCAPDTFAPRIAAIRTRVNRRVFNRLFPKRHFRLPCLQAGVLELSATDPDRTRCR